MGYHHIKLCPFSKKLCTIVLPWGKYEYKKIPMGLCNSPDIFQEKTNKLFNGLDYVRAYIDDLLIISNKSLEDHIKKLDKALSRLTSASTEMSLFTRNELEYLGFKITKNK